MLSSELDKVFVERAMLEIVDANDDIQVVPLPSSSRFRMKSYGVEPALSATAIRER